MSGGEATMVRTTVYDEKGKLRSQEVASGDGIDRIVVHGVCSFTPAALHAVRVASGAFLSHRGGYIRRFDTTHQAADAIRIARLVEVIDGEPMDEGTACVCPAPPL